MGNGINKVFLIGYSSEPNVSKTNSGISVANIYLSTRRTSKNKVTGEVSSHIDCHKIIFFDKIAEIVEKNVKSNDILYIEGRLQTKKYIDKLGITRFITEVVCEQLRYNFSSLKTSGQEFSSADYETDQKNFAKYQDENPFSDLDY